MDVRLGRWDGLQIIDEMFSVNTRWQLDTFRLEEENIARSIGSFLYKEMDERNEYIPIEGRPSTVDKDKRGKSMQARMRAGKVKFDKEAEWYADLEEELTKYPRFPLKDQFDAMSLMGLLLLEMNDPQTDKEVEDDEYDMMFAEDDYSEDRDSVTGY